MKEEEQECLKSSFITRQPNKGDNSQMPATLELALQFSDSLGAEYLSFCSVPSQRLHSKQMFTPLDILVNCHQ